MTPVTPMSPTREGSKTDTFRTSKLTVPSEANPAEEKKLNTTWTLYADSHPITIGIGAAAKEQSFQPTRVKTVSDLEGFWRLWRTLKPPSSQVPSFTFYFFRKLINPTWEDARNKTGGMIYIPLWDRDRAGLLEREDVDDVWWLTAMQLAGES